MKAPQSPHSPCQACAEGDDLGFDFKMALQPIVNATDRSIFAHEALVRGPNNEPAGTVFAAVNDSNLYRFDQLCRVRAIELAAALNLETMISVNFMPNAIYQPERCIQTTLEAAARCQFPLERIIFEITESEQVQDIQHLRRIAEHYRQVGFTVAIDDFGAGYSGLNLLAEVPADLLKLDMALIRGVEADTTRQAIIYGVIDTATRLSMRLIAEGVETYEEFKVLRAMGIELFQGYLFARPAFQSLAPVQEAAFEPPTA
jgi:EAL domain-containing protein (putative c-di-GMP-specific phosphodiesterase class I)